MHELSRPLKNNNHRSVWQSETKHPHQKILHGDWTGLAHNNFHSNVFLFRSFTIHLIISQYEREGQKYINISYVWIESVLWSVPPRRCPKPSWMDPRRAQPLDRWRSRDINMSRGTCVPANIWNCLSGQLLYNIHRNFPIIIININKEEYSY